MVRTTSPSHRRAFRSPHLTPAVAAVTAVAAVGLAVPVVANAVVGHRSDARPDSGRRALVQVHLAAPPVASSRSALDTVVSLSWKRRLPAGTVVVRADGHRVATVQTARGTRRATVQVTVPPLPAGAHLISAAFRTDDRLMGKSTVTQLLADPGPVTEPPVVPPPSSSSSPTAHPTSHPTSHPSSASPTTATPTPSSAPTTSAPTASTPAPSSTPTTTAPTTPPTTAPTSPPTTATPTQGPVGGSCEPVPSACGYPDATNTGPAPGSALTRVPGQVTSGPGWAWNARFGAVFVSGAGAVLQGLDVAGSVVIDAPDVTLRGSRITGCGGSDDSDVVAIRYQPGNSSYQGARARILDNEIDGTPAGCDRRARSGVRDVYGAAPDVLVRGNDIHGAGNGVTVEHQGLVADNWVHDLGHVAGDHHSGLSTHGGATQVTFRHNTVLLHGQSFAGGGGVSGAITVYSDFAHAQNTTIEDNFVSGGSYVIYGGNSGDDYSTPATGIKIRGNRFVCGDWLYGPVAAFDAGGSGNEWSRNVCDRTGASVPG